MRGELSSDVGVMRVSQTNRKQNIFKTDVESSVAGRRRFTFSNMVERKRDEKHVYSMISQTNKHKKLEKKKSTRSTASISFFFSWSF